LKVELVSGIESSRWAELLSSCPYASPFQHEGWAQVLAASIQNFDCFWLIAADSSGTYLGGMPLIRERKFFFRRYLSMPYGTYGGFVLAEEDELLAAELMRALARLLSDSKSHSFSCALSPRSKTWSENIRSLLGSTTAAENSTHVLELAEGFDSIWMAYQKRNRNIIRKAVKAGTTARVVSGPEPARTLYELYRGLARSWHGHYLYPYPLIEACTTYPGRPFAQIWQAVIDDHVHGSLLAIYDDEEVFPWLMGSTPYSRTLGVNNFLLSELIRDACNRGLARVNLGGSMGNPGIEHFKRALGATKVPVTHYVWDGRLAAMARRVKGLLRR
jgi:CelD/BcsL family acetyltransferase involved in cellulose biosynthesis